MGYFVQCSGFVFRGSIREENLSEDRLTCGNVGRFLLTLIESIGATAKCEK